MFNSHLWFELLPLEINSRVLNRKSCQKYFQGIKGVPEKVYQYVRREVLVSKQNWKDEFHLVLQWYISSFTSISMNSIAMNSTEYWRLKALIGINLPNLLELPLPRCFKNDNNLKLKKNVLFVILQLLFMIFWAEKNKE